MTDYSQSAEVREASELADRIVSIATHYRITSAADAAHGAVQLKEVKGAQARLEALRTAITGPLNAALRSVNDLFRGPAGQLAEAEQTIKRELARYVGEQELLQMAAQRVADEAARKEREKLEAQSARAAEAGRAERADELAQRAAMVVAPVVERAPLKVSGVQMRTAVRFVIEDASLLPREYLVPDEARIRKVVQALKQDARIPGVRVIVERAVAAGAA